MLEVEVKAKVDEKRVEKKLLELGAEFLGKELQTDTYLNHPCVDFKSRDEALRIRETDGKRYVTFKGPRKNTETKTREELQVEIKGDIRSLLVALGFAPMHKIIKKRKIYHWQALEIMVDRVENLGNFLEVEGKTTEDESKIFHLLDKLGISRSSLTNKSYLELILEK